MDDTQKMLQAIIHGQGSLKQELVSKINRLEEKLVGRIDGLETRVDGLDSKIDGVEKRLIKRLDNIGRQLAYLEDDAPTREEFDKLEAKVDKIEHKTAGISQ